MMGHLCPNPSTTNTKYYKSTLGGLRRQVGAVNVVTKRLGVRREAGSEGYQVGLT